MACVSASTRRSAPSCALPVNRLPNSLSADSSAVLQLVVDLLLLGDAVEHCRAARLEEAIQVLLRNGRRPRSATPSRKPLVRGIDDRDLLLDRQRLVLRLLQDLDEPRAAIELGLRRLIEVAAELRERRELAILREVEPQRAGDLPHRLDLRRAADARHRVADVDGGTHALVEQIALQEDLAVGDRDDVGRDVRREVAGLRFDDRQRGERAAAELVVQLRGALQQARVQVEDVARVRLAARRTAEQQRNFAIRPARASTDRRRPPARDGRSRGRTRRSRTPSRARCRASAPDPTPSRRRRRCSSSRRLLRACAPPARRSTASGRSRCRCR